jgi:hypothetical protein
MRLLVLTTLALVLAACTAGAASQPNIASPTLRPTPADSPTPPTVPTALATPIPLINVDDMMGMYPQQTVFVATANHVTAVTLLNHFTRYQIATEGFAEVSADPSARWLYVLDADAPGSRRLRIFDVPGGSQRGIVAGLANVPEGGHTLGVAASGRVLLLKADSTHAWVDMYEATTLQPLGAIMQASSCSDRLLTSANRIATVCSSTGAIAVNNLRGTTSGIDGALSNVVGAAMADTGALYVASANEQLASVASGGSTLATIAWPAEWSGSILPDGLALAQGGQSIVFAETNEEGAWLRVSVAADLTQRKSLRLAGAPHGGILAMWPFAYYALGSTIRHVDLNTGLLETMAEIGPEAVAAAVVNG